MTSQETVVELSIKEKLSRLGMPNDENQWLPLRRWAKLTALKYAQNKFHPGHWWRGPLLYSLVQYYQPRHILELGTGRGYGAICMANAAVDGNFPCTIWTVDQISPTTLQEWPIDEGEGPLIKRLSLKEIWDRFIPPPLKERIRLLTDTSSSAMKRWNYNGSPQIDFCFIDGGHDYRTVKHDFAAALQIANPGCHFLFDDYTERKNYGVKRLINEEIIPRLPKKAVELIDTSWKIQTPHGEEIQHKMAFVRALGGNLSLGQDFCKRGRLFRNYIKSVQEILRRTRGYFLNLV